MAIITTTADLQRQYNAFTGLSALERTQSGIARAEVVYYNVNDTWSTSAGNNRIYSSARLSLPKDFGYVLTDCFISVSVSGQDVVYTEATGTLTLYVGGVLGPQINVPLVANASKQDSNGGTAIGSIPAARYNTDYPSGGDRGRIIYTLKEKPTSLLYPFGSATYTSTPNPATEWEFNIGEQVLGGPSYDVSTYLRFLQYDIDQSYNYVLQSPQLTR